MVACLFPRMAEAQQIEFTPPIGRAGRTAAERVSGLPAPSRFGTRDTVLARGDTVPGNLLVLGVGCSNRGNRDRRRVFVVDGDLFLRPESHHPRRGGCARRWVSTGPSWRTIEGELTYRPSDMYRVVPRSGGYVIYPREELPEPFSSARSVWIRDAHVPEGRPGHVDLGCDGAGRTMGLANRAWKASARFTTEHGEFQGSLKNYWYPSAVFKFGIEAERITRSKRHVDSEELLEQPCRTCFVGEDFRNYYSSDRVRPRFESQ